MMRIPVKSWVLSLTFSLRGMCIIVSLFLISGIVTIAVWNAQQQQLPKQAVRLLAESHFLLSQFRLTEAEVKLRQLLKIQPERTEAVTALAEILFTQGRRLECRNMLWNVVPANKNPVPLLNMIWGTYHDTRLSELYFRAERTLTKAVEINPSLEIRRGLAYSHLLRGTTDDLTNAERILHQCLLEAPQDRLTATWLITCLMEQQRFDESDALLNHMTVIYPQDPEFIRLQARLCRIQNQWQGAEQQYRMLLTFLPGDLECLNQLSLLEGKKGHKDESLTFRSRWQTSTELLKEAEHLLQQLENTSGSFEKSNGSLCIRLANICKHFGQFRYALAWYEFAKKNGISDPELEQSLRDMTQP